MKQFEVGRRWSWNLVRATLIAAAFAAALVVIVASPLFFGFLARRTSRWADLANVGQAYGGIAALLSGLAVAGVTISLLLQWRQAHSDRILAVRQRHFELVKLSIEEPL